MLPDGLRSRDQCVRFRTDDSIRELVFQFGKQVCRSPSTASDFTPMSAAAADPGPITVETGRHLLLAMSCEAANRDCSGGSILGHSPNPIQVASLPNVGKTNQQDREEQQDINNRDPGKLLARLAQFPGTAICSGVPSGGNLPRGSVATPSGPLSDLDAPSLDTIADRLPWSSPLSVTVGPGTGDGFRPGHRPDGPPCQTRSPRERRTRLRRQR